MKEIDSASFKRLQLDILSSIHLFCISNNIRYSLALGTLLGAVRHKGFIPWDDDIDIMMPREDYERFIRIFSHEIYKVIDLSTTKDYYLPFAKVSDSRTIMIEDANAQPSFGVNVDVFPIDNVPDDNKEYKRWFREKWFWNYIQWAKLLRIKKDRDFLKNIVLCCAHVVFFLFPRRYVLKRIQTISMRYRYVETSRKGLIVPDDNKYKWVMEKDVFEHYTDILFENLMVRSVRDTDTYLKAMYGDYMTLPPIEQRITHHDFIVGWLE